MTALREPYNDKYCKEINCPKRSGNKCTEDNCTRDGGDKWAAYWTIHEELANGDKIDA